jgi:hypothetical protein
MSNFSRKRIKMKSKERLRELSKKMKPVRPKKEMRRARLNSSHSRSTLEKKETRRSPNIRSTRKVLDPSC